MKSDNHNISQILEQKKIQILPSQIDKYLEAATIKAFRDLKIRIPGKYKNQKEIIHKYELECRKQYKRFIVERILSIEKSFSLEEIDRHILFLTEMEFGIKLY